MRQLFRLIEGSERLEREMLLLKRPQIVIAYFLSTMRNIHNLRALHKNNEELLLEDGMESALAHWIKMGYGFSSKEVEEKFRKQANPSLLRFYDEREWPLSKKNEGLLQDIVASMTVREMYDDICKNSRGARAFVLRWSKNSSLVCGYLRLGHLYADDEETLLEEGMEEARDVFVKKGRKFSEENYNRFMQTAPQEIIDIHEGRAQVSEDEDLEFHEESLSAEDIALLRSIYDGTRQL